MINTSDQYKTTVKQSGRRWRAKADFTLADGTVLHLVTEDFMPGGVSVVDGVSGQDAFEVGRAASVACNLKLSNSDGRFNAYNFYGATFAPWVGLVLPDDSIEWIPKGIFTVNAPAARGATVGISSYDNMMRFDQKYNSTLPYPATLSQILNDACTRCGVTLETQEFTNDSYVVAKRPTDDSITYRDIVSYVAQLAGCWARCNYLGALVLGWYDMDALVEESGYDGGDFSDWADDDEDVADGGDFEDWGYDDVADGGLFVYPDEIPAQISFLRSCSVSTDPVHITGIQVTPKDTSQQAYMAGYDGYVISIDSNPLAQDGIDQLAANLAARFMHFSFFPMQVSALNDPAYEAGDVAWLTDPKGRQYRTLISNLTYTIGGSESFSADAESPSEKQGSSYSAAAKALKTAKQEAARQITAYDVAVQQMTSTLAMSMGMFQTVEVLDDGSRITYQHDKPTLAESTTIWKHTANAFAVSDDGGQTWHGMTADGNALVKVLTAVGINAEWIRTGLLSSQDGGTQLNLDDGAFSFGRGGLSYSSADGLKANQSDGTYTQITGAGVKATHEDGSYTTLDGRGLRHHDAGGDAEYHYLIYQREVQFYDVPIGTDGWTEVSIQLPDSFKGKSFTISLSLASATARYWVPSGIGTIANIGLVWSDVDYQNATFKARGFLEALSSGDGNVHTISDELDCTVTVIA